jgi:hypothetical protein
MVSSSSCRRRLLPCLKHGEDGFQQFMQEKIVALPGDIIYDNVGLDAPTLEALAKDRHHCEHCGNHQLLRKVLIIRAFSS